MEFWNVYSDEYKDRVKRSNAWKEIVEVLQRNQEEVIYGLFEEVTVSNFCS